jgi:organic hydroperoxide reductase OsmC/OhrA
MASYRADVEWRADGGFASGEYSRGHIWRFDGGAVVPASSSPEVVPLPFSDPAAVDPEEALVASASSCHMLWFLMLAQKAGFDVAGYSDSAHGDMRRDERGKIAMTRITLAPRIRFEGREPSAEELDRLHHQAHESCFIANSLRTEIVVEQQSDEPPQA